MNNNHSTVMNDLDVRGELASFSGRVFRARDWWQSDWGR